MKLSRIIRASVRSRESGKGEVVRAYVARRDPRRVLPAYLCTPSRPILSSWQMNRPLTGPRHARCPSSLRTKLERGWSWNPIRRRPHCISHQSPDVRPPPDLIRNGQKTMRAPGPSDGLGIKRLFSQGLGRYTGLKSAPTRPFSNFHRPHAYNWVNCSNSWIHIFSKDSFKDTLVAVCFVVFKFEFSKRRMSKNLWVDKFNRNIFENLNKWIRC